MIKVVVTGGAGFIGSHLSHKLADLGYPVVIIDNLLRGKLSYIQDILDDGTASFVKGDIRNSELMHVCMKDAWYVFHLAAVCINHSVAHPQESIAINVEGTFNVLKACHDAHVEKVVFSSSASVYGNPVYLPMDEKHPLNPITPYCVAKIAGEYLLEMFARQGLKYVAFRNFNVYGPRQATDAFYTSVIMKFIEALTNGEPPTIFGDGSQSMDFIHVDDVVDAYVLALESNVENEVFNLGSGSSTSIKQLFNIMCNQFKCNVHPLYYPQKRVVVQKRRANIGKAKKLLGFMPKICLEEGLNALIHPETIECKH